MCLACASWKPERIALEGNRRLPAGLPIEPDAKGEPCLVRSGAQGAYRKEGDHTVFGDLPRHG